MTDIYSGDDPRDIPAYSMTAAARYLCLSKSTLRAWVRGYRYVDGVGDRRFLEPVIELPGPEPFLSFNNVVEAHVLRAIRQVHGVSLPRVRRALDYVAGHFELANPLAHQSFETDGIDLFVTRSGALINVSGRGQIALREAFQAHLQRIERDEAGLAARLFPFTRSRHDADSPRAVVIDPRISFGKPVIAGTGVPIEVLAERFQAGDSSYHLAYDYSITADQVEEAIRCEREAA